MKRSLKSWLGSKERRISLRGSVMGGVTVLVAVLSMLVAAKVFRGTADLGDRSSSDEPLRWHAAERSRLVVSVKEGGTLKPVSETTLRNELSGDSRIVYLVEEGTQVQEGDLLVALDASELEDHLDRRKLALEKRQAALTAAESRLVVAQSDAESEVSKAALAAEFARLDLQKFTELERETRLHEAETEVEIARQRHRISQERFGHSAALAEQGCETRSTLERDRFTMNADAARLERALGHREIERRFDLMRRERALEAERLQSEALHDLARRKAKSKVAQAQARLESARMILELAQSAVEEVEKELEGTKVYAPHGGMVVYGGSASRQTRESMIEEGARVRRRQELVTIPDTSAMKIGVKLHETVASDVSVGQDAWVTLDAQPDKVYPGRVSHVSLFPERSHFWSRQRGPVYRAEITLSDESAEITPGSSGTAQILLHYLEDVVTVPLEAVSSLEGETMVEVQVAGDRTEARPVALGTHDGRKIHVIDGLEEGDVVAVREAG